MPPSVDFTDGDFQNGSYPRQVQAEAQSIQHVRKVLRQKGKCSLFWGDGKGSIARGEIDENNRTLLLEPPLLVGSANPKPRVHLLQANLKRKANEWLLQKASELGAHSLSFFVSQHCAQNIVFEKSEQTEKPEKEERLQKILRSACEQSRNPFVPRLYLKKNSLQQNIEELLKRSESSCLFLWGEWRESKRQSTSLATDFSLCELSQEISAATDVYFINGPEGGWSNEELLWLKNRFRSIVLSKNVLRAETAALAALSVLNFLYQYKKEETYGQSKRKRV